MKNVTVTLDEETALWARLEAARRDISVSSLIRQLLVDEMGGRVSYEGAKARYLARQPSRGAVRPVVLGCPHRRGRPGCAMQRPVDRGPSAREPRAGAGREAARGGWFALPRRATGWPGTVGRTAGGTVSSGSWPGSATSCRGRPAREARLPRGRARVARPTRAARTRANRPRTLPSGPAWTRLEARSGSRRIRRSAGS